jgi:hypothetical protein
MSINRLLELHDLAKQESRKYDRKRFLFPQLMRDTGKHFTVLEGRPLEYWSESRPRGKVGVSGMTTPIIQWNVPHTHPVWFKFHLQLQMCFASSDGYHFKTIIQSLSHKSAWCHRR